MPTHKLILQEQEAIELIALRSSEPPYKVVWGLNKALGVKMKKVDDYSLDENGQVSDETKLFTDSKHSPRYEVFALEMDAFDTEALVLVSNKDQGRELFTEAQGFDMVIFISSQELGVEEITEHLNELPGTLTTRVISCISYARLRNPFNYFDL